MQGKTGANKNFNDTGNLNTSYNVNKKTSCPARKQTSQLFVESNINYKFRGPVTKLELIFRPETYLCSE